MRVGTLVTGRIDMIAEIASENPYVIFRALDEPRSEGKKKIGLYFCTERDLRYVTDLEEAPLMGYGITAWRWVVMEDFTLDDSLYKRYKPCKEVYTKINLP